MFDFLNDIKAAVLIYDKDLCDYIFIGKTVLKQTGAADLNDFKTKYCHNSSIFSTLSKSKPNDPHSKTKHHYFFVPSRDGTTLCFEIKMTSPIYEGRSFLVFSFYERTEVKTLKTQLENYRIAQAMIFSMISSTYNKPDVTMLPPHLIASLGIALNVSAVLIYGLAPGESNQKNSYMWHNDNISIPENYFKNITDKDKRLLREQFLKGRRLVIETCEQATEQNAARMKSCNIKSLAAYPIYIEGKPELVIILYDCINPRDWEQESETMEIVTTILSSLLSGNKKLQASEKREAQLKAILNSFPFFIHISDYKTHEIVFANRLYEDFLHKEIIGIKCWELADPNQTAPCPFCNKDQTIDANGLPTERLTTRYFNALTQKEYYVYESAIRWFDNRYVHFSCAIPFDKTENPLPQA